MRSLRLRFLASILISALGASYARALQEANEPEVTTQETQPAFKIAVERNLVVVRAVVRDSKGRAVTNLRKEDFRVVDNGKPQSLTQFAVERFSAPNLPPKPASAPSPPIRDTEAVPETTLAPTTPRRFLALYFDDVHLSIGDILPVRRAAERFLATGLGPAERVGIFTSSGQIGVDFTDDRAKVRDAMLQLVPKPVVPTAEIGRCPEISFYQAYLIVHRRDESALDIATQEVLHCSPSELIREDIARQRAETDAYVTLSQHQAETQFSLRALEQLVRRMATVPGQRNIVVISPGFLAVTDEPRIFEVIERALRSNVTISALDARGLYVSLPLGDASAKPMLVPGRADIAGKKAQFILETQARPSDVLQALAWDTGGEFFHNSNDYDEGFRKVSAPPEAYYVLAFSPQNLKLDGRYHGLKVSLVSPAGRTVHARRGYYAPKKLADSAAQAKEEIQQAMFSQDEMREIPMEVHTQFFKVNETDARLFVLTRVDLRFVRFRKGEGRNLNNLTFVTALFDRDGKYVKGIQKILECRLRDITLDKLFQSGITVRTGFEVKAGNYLVRQVLRDAEGGQISAMNRAVEIPY